jgi:NADPH-dependent 2,4-dienoyl-CoA reductase/sulfur reductase-like enzyme
MTHHELIIIGGGPAGLAAATVAANAGVECLLIDEQATPGGQIYRGITKIPEQRAKLLGPDYQFGRNLVADFIASNATYQAETSVWHLSARREIGVINNNQASLLSADRVIIATGAMERAVPFSGWTLPGVMTAGAGQILLKSSGIVPENGVVIAGSGPLLLLLAWQYMQAGVTINAVLDLSPKGNFWRALPHLPRALLAHHYILKGLKYQLQLKQGGVPFYTGVSDLCALGKESLDAVEFTHKGERKTIETPVLMSHFGVIPDSHLSRSAGCDHFWDSSQFCWRPTIDRWSNSSIEGISVIGDGAGIGGAITAQHAGRLAGFECAYQLGRISANKRDESANKDRLWLTADLQVRPFLEALFRPSLNLLAEPKDETLICRCEEVSAGTIRQAIQAGHQDPNQIKFLTRCGMGPCQGRQCDNAISLLVGHELGHDIGKQESYRFRPPIRPLTIEQLANLQGAGEKNEG